MSKQDHAWAQPLGRSIKVVSVREKNPEHGGGFRRDSPSHLCVYLSVLRHMCAFHTATGQTSNRHTLTEQTAREQTEQMQR